jgi:hypothetical protein
MLRRVPGFRGRGVPRPMAAAQASATQNNGDINPFSEDILRALDSGATVLGYRTLVPLICSSHF